MVEISLFELLENKTVPLLVRVTKSYPLNKNTVLREGSHLTVLDRHFALLLFGRNHLGQPFRLRLNDGNQMLMECVNDFYPKNEKEVLNLCTKEMTYLLLMQRFGIGSYVCDAGEKFIYSACSEHKTLAGKLAMSFIRAKDGSIVDLTVEALTDGRVFAFIKVKQTITLESLLHSFVPQKVIFINSVAHRVLPQEVSTLEELHEYDTILTATLIKNRFVKYEKFQLNNGIMVEECEESAMPEFLKKTEAGNHCNGYQVRINKIESMLYYDIYARGLYGHYDTEISSLIQTDQCLEFDNLTYSLTSSSGSFDSGICDLTVFKTSNAGIRTSAIVDAEDDHYVDMKSLSCKAENNNNEIKKMSIDDVIQVLEKLGLEKHKDKFREHMVNGCCLCLYEDKLFYEDLGLSMFETHKLRRYVNGWRPNTKTLSSDELKESFFTSWSIENVKNELLRINLHSFAMFCSEQQVDGNLLSDLLEKNILMSLNDSHGIKLSGIQYQRFREYFTKQLKYEEHEFINLS